MSYVKKSLVAAAIIVSVEFIPIVSGIQPNYVYGESDLAEPADWVLGIQ